MAVPGPGSIGMGVLGMNPSVVGWLNQVNLPQRHYPYQCWSGTVIEESRVEFPAGTKIAGIPKNAQWQSDGIHFEMTYERLSPTVVRHVRKLVFDRPAQVCSVDYYAKTRPDMMKMRNLLRASVIYQ
jgi:hypothetical protein